MLDQYEATLRMIGAQGHLVCGHDKAPVYPKKDWQLKSKDVTLDAALSAYRSWGSVVRGVGVVCYDSLVVLDFDPIEKTINTDPETYEARKVWRENAGKMLTGKTYAEKSRSGRGSHYIFRVARNFSGNRGIGILRAYYAIDFLTGLRYCDITGDRMNNLDIAFGEAAVENLLITVDKKHPDDPGGGIGSAPGTVPIAALEEYLTFIKPDPEDYHTWITIGVCLWQETMGSNVGLKLWDDWSRKNGSYKYGMKMLPVDKWRTFKPTNASGQSVSIGTLIRMAEKGGANVGEIRLRHRVVDEVADAAAKSMKFGTGGK